MTRADEPAFPHVQDGFAAEPGMTLREYYAGLAMQGILAAESPETGFAPPSVVAKAAIARADALLAELEKPR